MYIFILFTLTRNINAVLSSLTDLSCFHMSADYIFTLERYRFIEPGSRGSIFLPPLACGFTLPQGDSRWGSPLFSFENLGLSLLNTHCFQHLGHTFSEGHYFLHPTLICFCFTLCHPYVFSAFAPLSLPFRATVWV